MSEPLTVQIFNSGYKPIPHDGIPGWDSAQQATWPASTSTLISGRRDALLVDALMTTDSGLELAQWVQASGKTPTGVYITHGHADHFFGAGPVLSAFPEARLTSLPEVIDEASTMILPEVMAIWDAHFPDGQFDHQPTLPEALPSREWNIEGHVIRLIPVGGADLAFGTVVHIPESDTVISGDIAYNNIHMWLGGSTPESREAWLASLDTLANLNATTIITGHRDPDAPDDAAQRVLDQSRRYLEDFNKLAASGAAPSHIVDAMMSTYAHFGNPYTLWVAAATYTP